MITCIVVAAGLGKRMNNKQNKLFLPLGEKPLLIWTLEAISSSNIDDIVIVAGEEEINRVKTLISDYSVDKVRAIVKGGKERQDSIANGLKNIKDSTEIVAIHDGARPLIRPSLINKLIEKISNVDGVIPAVTVTDTIKEVENNFVNKTLDRKRLKAVQTPQCFKKKPLLASYANAKADNFYATDDSALLERYGYKVKVIEGAYDNIKVTNPSDLLLASAFIKEAHI